MLGEVVAEELIGLDAGELGDAAHDFVVGEAGGLVVEGFGGGLGDGVVLGGTDGVFETARDEGTYGF